MNIRLLHELIEDWRQEAAIFSRRGLEREARMAESYAVELEERLRKWKLETLTLAEAAEELGVSYDTVQRKVASGELANAGRKNAPRVRRKDLFPSTESRRSTPAHRSRKREIVEDVLGRD